MTKKFDLRKRKKIHTYSFIFTIHYTLVIKSNCDNTFSPITAANNI